MLECKEILQNLRKGLIMKKQKREILPSAINLANYTYQGFRVILNSVRRQETARR